MKTNCCKRPGEVVAGRDHVCGVCVCVYPLAGFFPDSVAVIFKEVKKGCKVVSDENKS